MLLGWNPQCSGNFGASGAGCQFSTNASQMLSKWLEQWLDREFCYFSVCDRSSSTNRLSLSNLFMTMGRVLGAVESCH